MQTVDHRHTISALLQKAQEFHQAGDFRLEEKTYLTILSLADKHGVAMYLLGRLYLHMARFQEAEPLLKYVVEQHPEQTEARFLLGNVLIGMKQPAEAISHYHFLLRLDNKRVDILTNMGVALQSVGKLDEAESTMRRALALKEDATGYYNLGNLLRELRKEREAETAFRHAVELNPTHTLALYHLASLYSQQNRIEEAAREYQRVTLCKPDFLSAHFNLGNCLRDLGKQQEAVEAYRRVLTLDPTHVEAQIAIGLAFFAEGQIPDAIACYEKAISLAPENPLAHYSLGIALLLTGNYENGWAEYEYRLKCPAYKIPLLTEPRWNGENRAGKTLLLIAEQNVGDTLQFVRYVSYVRENFRRVTLACQPGLGDLLRASGIADNIEEIDPKDPMTPDFDTSAPLMSLPHLLKMVRPFQTRAAYLHPAPMLELEWASRLTDLRGKRVGLCWTSSSASVPLDFFDPLGELTGISWVSLQTGAEAKSTPATHFAKPLGQHLTDHSETAAAISNLDLVITVDSSVAHLAGALGKPVWLLLPFLPDWRWGLNGESTPWYPSMRLFRQPAPGDWESVFAQVISELTAFALPLAA